MKFIFAFLSLLISFSALAQYHVTYHIKYLDKITYEEITVNPDKAKSWQEYFITDGSCKSYFDSGPYLMEFYNASTNELVQVDPNQKLIRTELSRKKSTMTGIERIDTTTTVLGYECVAVKINYKKSYSTYFFSDKFTVSPESFAENSTWYEILNSTEGAIPLNYITVDEDYIVVGTATSIEKVHFKENDFEALEVSQNLLDKNLEEFKAIQQAYLKNYTETPIDLNQVRTLYIKGHAMVGKLTLPLKGYVDYPDFMYMEMDFQNLHFLLGKNPEYEWNYNPIEDLVVKTVISREKKNPEEGSNIFFPGMTSFIDLQNSLVLDIRKVEKDEKELTRVTTFSKGRYKIFYFDEDTYLVVMTEEANKISVFDNYKLFHGVYFPSKIGEIKDGKEGFSMGINEIYFDPVVEKARFYIPDSLASKIKDVSTRRSAQDYYKEGEKFLEEQNYEKAVSAYKEALRQAPRNSLYYNQSGLAKLYLKDYYGAIADFSNAVNINPQYYVGYQNLGYTKRTIGDFENALKDYSTAIEIDSAVSDGYSDRGALYFSIENYEAALKDFEKVLQLDSTEMESYFNKAIALAQLDRHAEALDYYDKAISGGYTNASVYNYRGVSYYSQKKFEKALEDFEVSIKLDDQYATYKMNLGRTFSELGESKKAIKTFEKVIKQENNNSEAYNLLGIEYFNLSDFKIAVSHFSHAIELDMKNANYYDNRAAAKENLLDFMGAIEDYTSSLMLYPDDANIVYRRGLAKANSNNNFDACLDFKKALEMGYEEANEGLKQYCDHK